jgi:hypothetical protein
MNPDPIERTVKIQAQWSGGKWQLADGGEFPNLKDGAIVDLVLSAHYLADPKDVERWTEEITVHFLPRATELLIHVNAKKVPIALLERTVERRDGTGTPRRYVMVVLEDDLSISLVTGKKGTLNECKCSIPGIEQSAESVNEAYKKIATEFDPSRRSNAGNIFQLAFIERQGHLVKLDDIRHELQGRPLELDEKRAIKQARSRKAGSTQANDQMELFGGE